MMRPNQPLGRHDVEGVKAPAVDGPGRGWKVPALVSPVT
jgi:hypothetical protein